MQTREQTTKVVTGRKGLSISCGSSKVVVLFLLSGLTLAQNLL